MVAGGWGRVFGRVMAAGVCFSGGVATGAWHQDLPWLRIASTSAAPQSTSLAAVTASENAVAAVPATEQKSRASEIMRFGYPGFDNLRTYEDFVLSYDRRNRTAHWVVEHLTPEGMVYNDSVDRGKCTFRSDTSIHEFFRSDNTDYKGSGYDRGHMAAAGNHRRTQTQVDQTFLLSNMAPQVGKGFNRDKWNDLERRARKLAKNNRNVFVCTGPLYLPRQESDGAIYVKYKVIGKNHVAVPTHFFKVLLIEVADGKFDLESYVLPNQPIADQTPLANFHTPLESVERAAGFIIFQQLSRNLLRNVNGKKVAGFW